MGCPFIEAYGQTENTGGAFIQNLYDTEYGKLGHVWVDISLYSQITSSNWQTFRKWATPVTIRTKMETRLPEGKFGWEVMELFWDITNRNN
jgi:hypothetical protein